jgi:hypothetical protein
MLPEFHAAGTPPLLPSGRNAGQNSFRGCELNATATDLSEGGMAIEIAAKLPREVVANRNSLQFPYIPRLQETSRRRIQLG